MKRLLTWFWRRRWRTLGAASLLVLVMINVSAFLHARAMTHFVAGGERTPRPEALPLLKKVKVLLAGVNIPRPANQRTPADLGLDYSTHTVRTEDGLRLEAWRIPARSPAGTAVLFHGYAVSKASVLPQARVFLEQGFDALLVDFRGSGGSDGNATTLGHDEALDVAAAVKLAESLGAVRPMILFGYSMGSVAVMRAVAECGVRADAVILEGPFSTLLRAVKNRFTLMGLPSFPAAHLLVFWGGVQHGFNAFSLDALEYARKVTCPVLILHGGRDQRSTVEEARALSEALTGPATLRVFEKAGHDSAADRQPAKWREAVASFLTRIGSSFAKGARQE